MHVVVVRRVDGEAIYHSTPGLTLASGDTLVLMGNHGAAAAIQDMQVSPRS